MFKSININKCIQYHGKNILVIFFLLFLLVLVRYNEHFFYDPLRPFFENDYLYKPLPEIAILKFNVHLLIRYSINTIISIGIIWYFFKKMDFVVFSAKFYLLLLPILFISLNIFLIMDDKSFYLLLFYIRRFMIQPLFLFLLLPAFHYQNSLKH